MRESAYRKNLDTTDVSARRVFRFRHAHRRSRGHQDLLGGHDLVAEEVGAGDTNIAVQAGAPFIEGYQSLFVSRLSLGPRPRPDRTHGMVLTACPTLLFAGNSALDHGLFSLLRQVEGPPRIAAFRTPSPSALSSPQSISDWAPTPPQDNAGGEEEDVENILRRSPATALSETIIIGRGPPRSFDSYDKERTAMGNHILALQNRISEYQRQQADGDAKIRDLEQKHKDAEGVLSRELAKRDEELKRLTLEIEKLRDTAKNKMG